MPDEDVHAGCEWDGLVRWCRLLELWQLMGEIELTIEELLARPIVAITVDQELPSAIDI